MKNSHTSYNFLWILAIPLICMLLYGIRKISTTDLLEGISAKMHWRLLLYMFIIVFTVTNNVGTQQMGYYMPAYISFTLYFTTAVYTILFGITAYITNESWKLTREQIKYTIFCGFLAGTGGIFSQVAVPYIAPEFSALFSNFQSPLTWIISFFLYKERSFTVFHLFGTLIMTGGLLYGSIYSLKHGTGSTNSNTNPAWAMIMAIISAVLAALLTIVQEHLYRKLNAPKFVCLTYYNFITLPMYCFWIFSSTTSDFGQCLVDDVPVTECANNFVACNITQLPSHEQNAFKCFFGDYNIDCCGGNLATVWTIVFVFGYWLMFTSQAMFLKCKNLGSDAVANSIAIATPLSLCFFWWPQLAGVGFGYTEYEPWILASVIAVTVGLLFYEILGDKKTCLNKNLKNGSNLSDYQYMAIGNPINDL